MADSTMTFAGLDVHARSVRLAAVRSERLVGELTVAAEVEVIERELRPFGGGFVLL